MLGKMLKKDERGFTLAELLVVVAIIAILVAVSIPIFTSKLEKSREATDVANLRAAKAAATVAILNEDYDSTLVWYDADSGKLVKDKPANYGKGTTKNGGTTGLGYNASTDVTSMAVKVTYTISTTAAADDSVSVAFAAN